MASADIAYVYYNPETVRHKKLAFFEPQAVYDAFGTPRLEVFTDSKALFEKIKNMDLYEKNLLIMTSGNLGGVNLLGFPDLIGFDEKRT